MKRPGRPRDLCACLALVTAIGCFTRALPAEEPPSTPADDGPSSKAEISDVMRDVRRKYGRDAVMLEGHLLGHAVRSGSVGETVLSIGGFEDHDGRHFLMFQLDTGIIYNDREVSAAARPARAWSEIVEPSLRQFRAITLPADGIGLRLSYAHRDYGDEAEVRTHIRDQPGAPEAAVFYLRLSDIGDLVVDRISAQQLIDSSAVLVNGLPAHVILAAPTPTGRALTH